MLVFENFELAPGLRINAAIRRGAVHVLALESDDLHEDFLARYLADLSGGGERGEIWLEEVRDAAGQPRRLRDLPEAQVRGYFTRFVGFILRDGGLIESLTLRENLLLPFRYLQVWPHAPAVADAEIARRLSELLAFPGAPDALAWLDRLPAALTLAQRRLAGLVRTYVRHPDLVIAFSPFAGLGPAARQTLAACIQHYRALRPECAHLLVVSSTEELRDFPATDLVPIPLAVDTTSMP